jgi:hypothetical protein
MKPTASPSPWRPLRVTIFRNLLIADVISDAGAFMQNVGAAWLMVSLGAGPIYVALTQTAASAWKDFRRHSPCATNLSIVSAFCVECIVVDP